MISGNIAPVSAPVTQVFIGTHAPPCPLGACGYSMAYFSSWATQPQLAGRNVMVMGSESTNSYTSGGISNLLSEDLWNIDTKIDDGQADLGVIVGNGCLTGTYPTRTYLLTYTGACKILVDFFK